jgi:hypothetical protein
VEFLPCGNFATSDNTAFLFLVVCRRRVPAQVEYAGHSETASTLLWVSLMARLNRGLFSVMRKLGLDIALA